MTNYVVDLSDADDLALAGGKAVNLAALMRVDGVRVPPGFVVTTAAFRPHAPIPAGVADAIAARAGESVAYAVRSSATAEDLPGASFAGQHDSYLNVTGRAAVLAAVRRCWDSLFTGRAVAYRARHGIGDGVAMAVVVQRMVAARASGVLFTADPVSGHRGIATVEAVPGLGDALVSGRVNPDSYRLHGDELTGRGVLTEAEVRELVRLGRRVEAHFGRPQDIEWCLDGDGFQIVQSRPITTLFPIPEQDDDRPHVYVSVGHQQMMTEAMTPLGLSFWQLTTPRPMVVAGGRLFVDVAPVLATPTGRETLIRVFTQSDPLMGDALRTVADRPGFLPSAPDPERAWAPHGAGTELLPADPAIVTELIAAQEASLAALKRDISTAPDLYAFLRADLRELQRLLTDPRSIQVIVAAQDAATWLNEHLFEWLGERNAADALSRSVPHNVTAEMGLALLDVADAFRPYPEALAHLAEPDRLPAPARDALASFLDRYGMRCVGEIDVTRPRWADDPAALAPMLLANLRAFEPGASARLAEQGRREATEAAADLLARLRALPGGERKAAETQTMIDRVRVFSGYREYPKYHMICRYQVYRAALPAGDAYFRTFGELAAGVADPEVIRERRAAFATYRTLTPPRVFTSEGETIAGSYHRSDLPDGALAGLGVSAGTVEGRARVLTGPAGAELSPGDVLVTAFTDPSWTPAFVTIAALVTEAGGLMTHGAVIAREYGLPAVVGVEGATRLIRDGQRVRVHGTAGHVELLD